MHLPKHDNSSYFVPHLSDLRTITITDEDDEIIELLSALAKVKGHPKKFAEQLLAGLSTLKRFSALCAEWSKTYILPDGSGPAEAHLSILQMDLGLYIYIIETANNIFRAREDGMGWGIDTDTAIHSFTEIVPSWMAPWQVKGLEPIDLTSNDVPKALKPLGKTTTYGAAFRHLMRLQKKRSQKSLPEAEFKFLLDMLYNYRNAENGKHKVQSFAYLLKNVWIKSKAQTLPVNDKSLRQFKDNGSQYIEFVYNFAIQAATALSSLDHPLHDDVRIFLETIGIDPSCDEDVTWLAGTMCAREIEEPDYSTAYSLRQMSLAFQETGDPWYQQTAERLTQTVSEVLTWRELTSQGVQDLLIPPVEDQRNLDDSIELLKEFYPQGLIVNFSYDDCKSLNTTFAHNGLNIENAIVTVKINVQEKFFYVTVSPRNQNGHPIHEFRYVVDGEEILVYLDVVDPEKINPEMASSLTALLALAIQPILLDTEKRKLQPKRILSQLSPNSTQKSRKPQQKQIPQKTHGPFREKPSRNSNSQETWSLETAVEQVRILPTIILSSENPPEVSEGIPTKDLAAIFQKIMLYNTSIHGHNLTNINSAKMLTFARFGEDQRVWQLRHGKYRILAAIDPNDSLRAEVFLITRRSEVKGGKTIR